MTVSAVVGRFRRPTWIAPTLALGILVLPAACSTTPGFGTVSGTAAPCVGFALPGQASVIIYARHDGRVVASLRVVLTKSPGNPYRLRLPAGTYVISAPRAYLPDRLVTVPTGRTMTVDFLPHCK